MSEFLSSLIDLLQKAFQAFDEVHLPVSDLARQPISLGPDQSTNVLAGPQTTGFYQEHREIKRNPFSRPSNVSAFC
jgi:hypothetical protein